MATGQIREGVNKVVQLPDSTWVNAVAQTDGSGRVLGAAIAPRNLARGPLTTSFNSIPIPSGTRAVKVWVGSLAKVGVGAAAAITAQVQEKQTLTAGDATSGNFTLGFAGQTASGNIAWNTSAANAVTALVAIASIGAGGVTASGGPLNTTPIVFTFAAGIIDGDVPILVPTTVDLAGGVSAATRLPTVAQTTTAVTSSGFIEGLTEQIFELASTDAFLYLAADSVASSYRVSFFS